MLNVDDTNCSDRNSNLYEHFIEHVLHDLRLEASTGLTKEKRTIHRAHHFSHHWYLKISDSSSNILVSSALWHAYSNQNYLGVLLPSEGNELFLLGINQGQTRYSKQSKSLFLNLN